MRERLWHSPQFGNYINHHPCRFLFRTYTNSAKSRGRHKVRGVCSRLPPGGNTLQLSGLVPFKAYFKSAPERRAYEHNYSHKCLRFFFMNALVYRRKTLFFSFFLVEGGELKTMCQQRDRFREGESESITSFFSCSQNLEIGL